MVRVGCFSIIKKTKKKNKWKSEGAILATLVWIASSVCKLYARRKKKVLVKKYMLFWKTLHKCCLYSSRHYMSFVSNDLLVCNKQYIYLCNMPIWTGWKRSVSMNFATRRILPNCCYNIATFAVCAISYSAYQLFVHGTPFSPFSKGIRRMRWCTNSLTDFAGNHLFTIFPFYVRKSITCTQELTSRSNWLVN